MPYMKPFRVYSFYFLSYVPSSNIFCPSTHFILNSFLFGVSSVLCHYVFFLQADSLSLATDVCRPYSIIWHFRNFWVIIRVHPYNSNLRADGHVISLQIFENSPLFWYEIAS